MALVLIGMLLFTTAASGASGLKVPTADGRRATAPAEPAPAQHWGSAAGQDHLDGANGNRTVPTSLRSRYPQHRLKQQPAAGRNVARVVAPPARQARGFD
ncbi:hypothetical protein OG799_08720 [Micromonospora sp. NBC_00898]|uniref:hypothetical protein n=1 Tax=Micromonospora sp. NBC_00898 TaxID=2975981 RepID=UPI003863A875|nr:hypothetical protein OG799_08720 [Micromonospora sp. NBC_00898]